VWQEVEDSRMELEVGQMETHVQVQNPLPSPKVAADGMEWNGGEETAAAAA